MEMNVAFVRTRFDAIRHFLFPQLRLQHRQFGPHGDEHCRRWKPQTFRRRDQLGWFREQKFVSSPVASPIIEGIATAQGVD